MGVPSRSCNPRERNWEPLPIPPVSRPRPAPPGLAPPLPRSRRVPSRSGDPREHNWDRPPPKAIGISTRAARVYPAPGALPARFQPQWPPPRAQLGRPPPPPPGADPRPTLPVLSQPQWGPPRAQLGPPPTPATTRFPTRAARVRPAPGALPTFTGGSR